MKTFTIDQFLSFLENSEFSRSTDYEEYDALHVTDDGDTPYTKHMGNAWLRSSCDGVTIYYNESFDYVEYDEESLSHSTQGLDNVWDLEGARIVDEDGDQVSICDLVMPEDFAEIDYSFIDFGNDEVFDVSEESEFHIVERDKQPNLKFSGELIAHVESSDNNAAGRWYSNSTGRYEALSLYKTKSGKFVCEKIGYTRWQGEKNRYSGAVCESDGEVIDFFGHGWLAKELYDEAGIEDVETIA